MFEQVIDWIKQNHSSARKIVEIGVGHRLDVAERLASALPQAEIIATDKDESWVRSRKTGRLRTAADDVMFPSISLYQGASLIYSLHPPQELISALVKLAIRVGAALLVVPTSDERHEFDSHPWRETVVQGKFVGWLLK